jgi:hypothetical protein
MPSDPVFYLTARFLRNFRILSFPPFFEAG